LEKDISGVEMAHLLVIALVLQGRYPEENGIVLPRSSKEQLKVEPFFEEGFRTGVSLLLCSFKEGVFKELSPVWGYYSGSGHSFLAVISSENVCLALSGFTRFNLQRGVSGFSPIGVFLRVFGPL